MDTDIGRGLGRSTFAGTLAIAISAVALTVDVQICLHRPPHLHAYRMTLGIMAALCLLCVARGDRATMGLLVSPKRGFCYWVTLTAVLGIGLVLFMAFIYAFQWFFHRPLRFPLSVEAALRMLPSWCIYYPVLEEMLYRMVLCIPLVALLGPWPAIVISGAAFGALHFLYGNPAPTNFVAGYLLAWAYLHSGSILVPIVWHSLGNAVILVLQVGASYWLSR